jgi:NADH:ubiquinone oxidoreductase subunit 6 (subunit J)
VCLRFRRRDTTSADTEADAVLVDIDGQKFFMTSNGYLVHKWKLLGAIYVGAVGVISSFLILLAHFDTFCLPRTWMHIFRDGSRGERNLILVLLLFWAGGLHVCTSSLSVGEVQANVYFTTWIGTYVLLACVQFVSTYSTCLGLE